jgi:aerobic carbon-monoxide dehydrogenase large subunit
MTTAAQTALLGLAGRPMFVGARVPRIEDDRLLRGDGRYIADFHPPGCVEMAVVRSFMAHGRIVGVNLDAGRAAPGVLGVFVAADLEGVSAYPDLVEYARGVNARVLASDRVRYVGQPVAVVVASDRYTAEDAAEFVEINVEELPAVASIEAALAPDAPRLYDDWPDNRIVEPSSGSNPEVDAALARHRVISRSYSMQRQAPMPMETRGCVAEFRDGRLTLWTSTQSSHIVRTTLAMVLGISEADIRVVAPNVGGGFGTKTHIYPEEVMVAWLATRLRRPVRWIEDRSEHMVASIHAREQVHHMEAAVDERGRIHALRCRITTDVGSGQIFLPGVCTTVVAAALFTGPYRIPASEVIIEEVVTNKTPSGAYRGFGLPEMCFALERLVDDIATEVGVDRTELRRDMLIGEADLPYTLSTGARIDSGSHGDSYEAILERVRKAEDGWRNHFAGDQRIRVGMGIAPYIEGTAPTYFGTTGMWTSPDSAMLRVEPDGSVLVTVGIGDAGQGLYSMVATLAADALGVPVERVRVVIGDTDLCPYGLGGWGSRSTVIGGGAVLRAADAVRQKILRVAGHLLEVDSADLAIDDGSIHVRGSDRPSISVADVARMAVVRTIDLPPGEEPGLEATAIYDPPNLDHRPGPDGKMNGSATYVNGVHATVVAVDVETGELQILEYLVAHDCGRVINPTIVEGQIHGGVAQGIGGSLYEHAAYAPEGQPLAANFMDYVIPSATEVPWIDVEHFESPAPEMPLGVKGAGEAGTVGAAAALSNAVCDALREFGVTITELPMTPAMIRRLITDAVEARRDRGGDQQGR